MMPYAKVITVRAVLSATGVSMGWQLSDVRKPETASACECTVLRVEW